MVSAVGIDRELVIGRPGPADLFGQPLSLEFRGAVEIARAAGIDLVSEIGPALVSAQHLCLDFLGTAGIDRALVIVQKLCL